MVIKTSLEALEGLQDRIFDYATYEVEMRTDYSGRGMYGKTCIGFTTDQPHKLAMTIASILTDIQLTNEVFNYDHNPQIPFWYNLNPSIDSMGLSSVLYFDNWRLDDN